MSYVIKLDKSTNIPFNASRGQIMRFDLWATDDECEYNDDAFINFSYAKTRKSVIQTLSLGSGIIKKSNGRFYCEFDTSIVHQAHDLIYAEFFPYGTGHKNITFSIGLNSSSYNI